MLEVRGLTCARGERILFADLSFGLGPGEWMQIKGQNGAGKTSLLRLVVGLAHAEAGTVSWRGHAARSTEFRDAVLYMGHHGAVKEELSAFENLRLAAELDERPLSAVDALRALARLGLRGREDLPVRVLSAGQKRRVLLARLLIRSAELWVLDEAFNALDVAAVALLGELIGEHLARGGAALLTSHQPLPLPGGRELSL